MLAMASQIDYFEEISALSADMVEAAKANDWDRLVMLEHEVGRIRELLVTSADVPLESEEIDRKRVLIHRILEDDAEIRRHTEPWMEHVRLYLGSQNRRRQVHNAYATGAGEQGSGGFGI